MRTSISSGLGIYDLIRLLMSLCYSTFYFVFKKPIKTADFPFSKLYVTKSIVCCPMEIKEVK
jgi:hypothetical protein